GAWPGRRGLARAAGLGVEAGAEGPEAAGGQRAAAHEREGDHHRDHDPGGAAVARAVRLVRPGWAGSGRVGTWRARRHGPWRAPRWRRTRWRRTRWRRARWRAERRRPRWRAERRRRLGRRTGWWGRGARRRAGWGRRGGWWGLRRGGRLPRRPALLTTFGRSGLLRLPAERGRRLAEQRRLARRGQVRELRVERGPLGADPRQPLEGAQRWRATRRPLQRVPVPPRVVDLDHRAGPVGLPDVVEERQGGDAEDEGADGGDHVEGGEPVTRQVVGVAPGHPLVTQP